MDTQDLAAEDSDLSEDEALPSKGLPTHELDRTPADRNAFFFSNAMGAAGQSLDKLRPLPSQIPFLLTVYTENVNMIIQVVHLPTITKMIHNGRRGQSSSLSPANEALMFAIYYAAVTSMEEEDVSSTPREFLAQAGGSPLTSA